MAHYRFRIRQGAHSSDIPVDLPDDEAAWNEAAGMFSDMLLDIIRQLRHDREWRLEVFDKSGTIRHRFLLTAETFNQ